MQDTYKTHDLISLSFAINDFNRGYIKNTNFDFNYENDTRVVKYSNIDILRFNCGIEHYVIYKDQPPVKINLNKEDFNFASEAIDKLNKRLSVKILSGDISSYEQALYNVIQMESVDRRHFVTIASLPSGYYRLVNTDNAKKTLRQYRDAPTLTRGERVSGDIKILMERYIKKLDAWSYYADFNGSLVAFIRNKKLPNDTVFHISARVKEVSPSWNDRTIMESKLNYMKIIDPSTRQKV